MMSLTFLLFAEAMVVCFKPLVAFPVSKFFYMDTPQLKPAMYENLPMHRVYLGTV